jgi:hypothetical protein
MQREWQQQGTNGNDNGPMNNALPAEVPRPTVRLPPFWLKRPAVWFAQAKAHFFLQGVNSEKSKFFHIISQLDQRCAAELEDITTSPPKQSPYTTLKAELVRRLTPAREQRICQFLTLEEIGDHNPSVTAAPQEPCPRQLLPPHLGQPATTKHSGYARLPARE